MSGMRGVIETYLGFDPRDSFAIMRHCDYPGLHAAVSTNIFNQIDTEVWEELAHAYEGATYSRVFNALEMMRQHE